MSETRRRGGHKTRVTTLIQNMSTELDREEINIETVSSLRSEILRQQEIITALDSKILLKLEEDEDINTEIAHASEYQMTINAAITCLLYTSPSPRDKRQSRMPSSA